MPVLISRAEALHRIQREGGAPPCLMCAIRAEKVGDLHRIFEDDDLLVFLPRFVRRWGHAMVMPLAHVTSFTDVDPALWAKVGDAALRLARIIERVQRPRRCYLASTGSSAGELLQSSTHLHMHVIPLYEADDRPADVFSWKDGVYTAERDEWEELARRYRDAWLSLPS